MSKNRLFHLSEDPNIEIFRPRPSSYTEAAVVWGISEERLTNYLLPRDCPRVTFFAAETTSDYDRERFLGDARQVMAIEYGWLARVRACTLYAYEFPAAPFRVHDSTAGYFVSPETVVPHKMTPIPDLLAALAESNVELRLRQNLWTLSEAVADSTLGFSIIRMRNTQPGKSG